MDFLMVLLPLGCSSNRDGGCSLPLLIKRWGGGGLFNVGEVSGEGGRWGGLPGYSPGAFAWEIPNQTGPKRD